MNIRSFTTFLAAAAFLFTVGSNDAFAKKNKDSGETALIEIAETGTSADEVFMAAKSIHDTLNGIQTKLTEGNNELVSALGLTAGTPFADALADLKAKAGDNLSVAMNGAVPSLTVADAAPENVKSAVASVNNFVTYHVQAIDEAKSLVTQAQEVAAKAQSLDPMSLAKEVASNPMDIPKVAKTITNNIKAVGQTPKRIEDTVTVLGSNVEAIKGLAN